MLPSHKTFFEKELKKVTREYNHSLYQPVEYLLDIGGKRIRPITVLLACELLGGSKEGAINQALAVEIFHNFTLMHDDIMDKAPLRRGQPTVHKKWNENSAILSGDAMLVIAYQYLIKGTNSKQLPQLLEVFNSMVLEVCEGQQCDMEFEKREDVTIAEYLKMIEQKTAVLLGACFRLGSIMANAEKETQQHLFDYGKNLGIAFQIWDDWLDVFGNPLQVGKKQGGDIAANKKTFLLLKAFELADANTKKELKESMSAGGDNKIKRVTDIYHKLKIDTVAQQEIDKYYQKAIGNLQFIEPLAANGKKQLMAFAEALMKREY